MKTKSFLLAAVLAGFGQLAAAPATIPSTTMGTNIHMIDRVGEDWKDYQLQLDQMKKEGILWGRSDCYIRAVEKPNGQWDFSEPVAFYKECAKRGIQVMPVITGSDNSIPKKGPNGSYFPMSKNLEKHKAYWRAFASAVKDYVAYWEFSNEPDGGNPGATVTEFRRNPALYVKMLAEFNKTIKSVDPKAKVVAAGLCGNDLGMAELPYVEKLLQAGIAKHCDVLNFHPYTGSVLPEGVYPEGMKALRALLKKYGADKKELWVTEFGSPTTLQPFNWNSLWFAGLKAVKIDPAKTTLLLLHDEKENCFSISVMLGNAEFRKKFKKIRVIRAAELGRVSAAGTVLPLDVSGEFPVKYLPSLVNYVKQGGTIITGWVMPLYFDMEKKDGILTFRNVQRKNGITMRSAWTAFWHDKSVPRNFPKLKAAVPGLPALDQPLVSDGNRMTITYRMPGRIIDTSYLKEGDTMTPLITSADGKYTVAGAFNFNSDFKGNAIISLLWDHTFKANSHDEIGRVLPRQVLLLRAEGIAKLFHYKFRINPFRKVYDYGVHGDGDKSLAPHPGAQAWLVLNEQLGCDTKLTYVHKGDPWIVRSVRKDGKTAYAIWVRDLAKKCRFKVTGKVESACDYMGKPIKFAPAKPFIVTDAPTYVVGPAKLSL